MEEREPGSATPDEPAHRRPDQSGARDTGDPDASGQRPEPTPRTGGTTPEAQGTSATGQPERPPGTDAEPSPGEAGTPTPGAPVPPEHARDEAPGTPDRDDAERTPPAGSAQPATGDHGTRPPSPPYPTGTAPGPSVPPGPGPHPGQPAGLPPVPNPWHGQPAGPPGPPSPGAAPAGGFLNQYQPMGSVQDGRDPALHDRYWEAQLEAGARNSLHWGFLAFFVGWAGYYLVAGLIGAILAGQFQEFDPLSPPPMGPLLLVSLIPNLFLGLGPAVLSWWKGQGLRRDFGIVPKRRDWKVGLLTGGIGLVAAFVMTILLMSGSLDENGESSGINNLGQLAQGQAVWILLFSLFVFIGAPLTEELLVRGALWGALEQYRVPRYAILLLTTFVFALIHEEPERTPVLLVGGLAIGIARMITGRVAAAIIAHATYNLLPAVVFYAQFSG